MDHDQTANSVTRPPLRDFAVQTVDGENYSVTAHLVFNNVSIGEGLVFRRYYDDSVRTEKVAEFQPGHWVHYYEVK